MISAFNSDNGPSGIHGNSVLYIDNLSFDEQAGSIPEQNISDQTILISPNPAGDFFTIFLKRRINSELNLNMYNVTGNLVKSCLVLQNSQQIETMGLTDGIYIIEIKSGNWSEKQKLILRK
jgi:hypothetical protein